MDFEKGFIKIVARTYSIFVFLIFRKEFKRRV
jgi:hypothetical protein